MTKLVLNRMKREYKELETRINKLSAFLKSAKCKNLSEREKDMLLCQLHAMNAYCIVLGDRISYYEGRPLIFEWRCKQ